MLIISSRARLALTAISYRRAFSSARAARSAKASIVGRSSATKRRLSLVISRESTPVGFPRTRRGTRIAERTPSAASPSASSRTERNSSDAAV